MVSALAELDTIVSSIPPQRPGGVSFPFVPTQLGQYSFFLTCDTIPAKVIEISETNNTASAIINVASCLPDLSVAGCSLLDVKPADPQSNGNIIVYALIQNSGLDTTRASFRVRLLAGSQAYFVTINSQIAPGKTVQIVDTIPTPVTGKYACR